MSTYLFHTPVELVNIAQKYRPVLTRDSPAHQMFPTMAVRKPKIRLRQKDNYVGMTQIRGYNGEAARVQMVGYGEYDIEPGVYTEQLSISERELATRAAENTINDTIDVRDLTFDGNQQLLSRGITREEWLIWTFLINGRFVVTNGAGQVLHQDGYTQRIYAAGTAWSSFSTSTPLADIRAMSLFDYGYSTKFDEESTLWINKQQAMYLLQNTNSLDFGGRKLQFGQTVNSIGDVNKLLSTDGLPNIGIYNRGYYDDTSTFHRWIPTGYGVLEGRRDGGEPVGHFFYTINVGREPGFYSYIEDKMMKTPAKMTMFAGFNGGPGAEFPSSLVTAQI